MNGLVCKVLNLVPRHEQIIAEILGNVFSRELTIFIGILEITMAVWIVLHYKTRITAITQIVVVLTMNFMEFCLVTDLLLWGEWNLLFALLFCGLVYYNEFILNARLSNRR